MLKRRRQIQKWISVLKNKKKFKASSPKNHSLLQNRLQQPQVKEEQQSNNLELVEEQQRSQQSEMEPEACWADSDDERQIQLQNRNLFKKFGKVPQTNKQYEKKVSKFYTKKYDKFRWAENAQVLQEKDVQDYMNEEIYYDGIHTKKKKVNFFARTHAKHESVVTGIDWKNNVMFTTGLDHKLKVWSLHLTEENPELKLQLEKDIYMKDLPLTCCSLKKGEVMMGTLRKNLVLVDTVKWKPKFITSNFLSDLHSYENLRVSQIDYRSAIFDNMKVSLLDANNVYYGSLLANEPIQDIKFSQKNANLVYGITLDAIYEWDLRKLQVSQMNKKYLGFSSLQVLSDSLVVGSKLGTVYSFELNKMEELGENSNLVTHVTHLSTNNNMSMVVALSKWKSNAGRVLNTGTMKAMGEWPSFQTKMGFPTKASFTENDIFGVGSSQGYVNVYTWTDE